MADVAREAGVGTMTVSRALRSPEQVSEKIRARITDAVRKLNYIPNTAAGTLRSNRSHMVAAIVPTISHSIFADTIEAMSEVLQRAGFHLVIGQSNYGLDQEEALIRTFIARQPEAIVVTGYTHTPAAAALLKSSGLPVVEIWNTCSSPIDASVGISNFDASHAMTRFLLQRGYRRIGYIGGLKRGNDRTVQREAGYRAALSEGGIPYERELIQRAPFDYDAGAKALVQLLARRPDIDCIFAASDILAIGVLLEANRQGIAVPERLAVAGFDDVGLAERMSPPLTTIRFPRKAIGQMAADLIVERLQGRAREQRVVELGFELVERQST
ncbi:LacI family DNA-binding transcriptional regulator [Mangrovicella endophytica]|uniref:LacI family DNA-binding transcriptional regulator n=1 Tax=Mangrovicella endophytica TaxID=2066697 RepID=UPI0018E4C28E|nr:LacI family DNA-binding transcriptional regulator [Mangrovicella endophytica]